MSYFAQLYHLSELWEVFQKGYLLELWMLFGYFLWFLYYFHWQNSYLRSENVNYLRFVRAAIPAEYFEWLCIFYIWVTIFVAWRQSVEIRSWYNIYLLWVVFRAFQAVFRPKVRDYYRCKTYRFGFNDDPGLFRIEDLGLDFDFDLGLSNWGCFWHDFSTT